MMPRFMMFHPGPRAFRLSRRKYDAREDGYYESLFALSNGRLCLRATTDPQAGGGDPGLLSSELFAPGRNFAHQAVAAIDPCWWTLRVGGAALSPATCELLSFRQTLDMAHAHGELEMILADSGGRATRLAVATALPAGRSDLIVSELVVERLDHDAPLVLELGADWSAGTPAAGSPGGERLHPFRRIDTFGGGHCFRIAAEVEGGARIDAAMALCVVAGHARRWERRPERFAVSLVPDGAACLRVFRLASIIVNARAPEPRENDFAVEMKRHRQIWAARWADAADIGGDAKARQGLAFGQFHLKQAPDRFADAVTIPPRGLTAVRHAGHTFFNTEFYHLPYYALTEPDVAQALLRFRMRTRGAAEAYARETGFAGARFPLVADVHGNPAHERTPAGAAVAENSLYPTAGVVYALSRLIAATGAWPCGGEDGLGLAAASAAFLHDAMACEEAGAPFARRVTGFDEFHPNVLHHTASNELGRWALQWTAAALDREAERSAATRSLLERLGAGAPAREAWKRRARHIRQPETAGGVHAEFEGYFDLDEPPPRPRGGGALPALTAAERRLAERDIAFPTRLTKQADVLMPMSFLRDRFDLGTMAANLDFYEPRTVHASSLSLAPHALAAALTGRMQLCWRLTRAALRYNLDYRPRADYRNGVHLGAYAGAWTTLLEGVLRFRVHGNGIELNPALPREIHGLTMAMIFRGRRIRIAAHHSGMEVYDSHGARIHAGTGPVFLDAHDLGVDAAGAPS